VSPSQNRKQGHLNIKKNKPVEIFRNPQLLGSAALQRCAKGMKDEQSEKQKVGQPLAAIKL
jgi:hypothetical protein